MARLLVPLASPFLTVRLSYLIMACIATHLVSPTRGQAISSNALDQLGWREYWELKLPNLEPPPDLEELASPLSGNLAEIEDSFICISRAQYSLCLCTRLDLSVCAAANISGGPTASTCVFHFFYEYHKNCKVPPHPIDVAHPSSSPQQLNNNVAFFNSSFLYLNINNSITLPTLSNPLLHSQAFLPRPLSNMLPFESAKLPESLSLLHIPPSSPMASSMQETLEFCGNSPQNEETLQCVTSIESMVDFVSEKLGSNAMVFTPTLATSTTSDVEQEEYSVAKVERIVNMTSTLDQKIGTCHNLVYPYLVYGCHLTRGSSVLSVSFEDMEGEAMVVCHHNTSAWNPTHPAFAELQAKPGDGIEVCHWIPHHHFVWVPSTIEPPRRGW